MWNKSSLLSCLKSIWNTRKQHNSAFLIYLQPLSFPSSPSLYCFLHLSVARVHFSLFFMTKLRIVTLLFIIYLQEPSVLLHPSLTYLAIFCFHTKSQEFLLSSWITSLQCTSLFPSARYFFFFFLIHSNIKSVTLINNLCWWITQLQLSLLASQAGAGHLISNSVWAVYDVWAFLYF